MQKIKHEDLPHNVDVEAELLSAMLLKDGEIVPQVVAELVPDDFYSGIYREIYRAILDIYESHSAPSMLLILDRLEKLPEFEDNSKLFTECVLELGDQAYTTAYFEENVRIIKEHSIRRQIIKLGEKFIRDATTPDKDVEKILANFEAANKSINTKATPQVLLSGYDFIFNKLPEANNKLKPYLNRHTGFINIDDCQIFSPALYVVGATPSAGKTTFCWQLLNQLSAQGESCIYCSYEMSAHEMYTKMLAREIFLRNPNSTLTAVDIRSGIESDDYGPVLNSLLPKKDYFTDMMELRDESIDDLLRLLRPHCEGKEKSPVVCIDYLQIIPPSEDKKLTTDKARIDDIVRKLKNFQRETNTTFIVISSFNRGNYTQQVAFESFKESGNIEYSADVVWAMQLDFINHLKIGEGVSATRKKFEEAARAQPRKIQLKCLKNRFGNKYDIYFDYYSAFDCFTVGVPSDFEELEDTADTSNVDNATTNISID